MDKMKNLRTEVVMVLTVSLAVIFAACSGSNEEKENNGKLEHTSELMQRYMAISDALVADDGSVVKDAAEAMISMTDLSDIMIMQLNTMAGSTDLEEQRMMFSDLSLEMYNIAQKEGLNHKVYRFHCPMALDNHGAEWLSISDEVSNPYMGQQMPTCGSLKEQL